MGNTKQSVTAKQVIKYLEDEPEFFLNHPDAIEALQLSSSPEGTISFSQRQTERLQEKNQQLQQQLHALIDNARQNTALQHRVHQLCLRLMDADSLEALLPLLMQELKHEFDADDVALRLFYVGKKMPPFPELTENISQCHADDASLQVFDGLLSKQQPVCGRLTKAQKKVLFPDQIDHIQSVACIPLGHDPCAGLLAIASSDENRFHADMATDYLGFLGEVIMRLIRPYHPHDHGR